MDELDLVRLTRPAVDEPGADALARIKAAALAPPMTDAVARGGSDAPDAPIELDVTAPATPIRRRRGLVLTSIAAAVLTVGGGIAVATRDRGGDRTAGSADTSIAAIVDGGSPSIGGTWVLSGGDLGVTAPPDVPAVRLVFDPKTGGYGITVCSTLVGTSARVGDGRLLIDDTPTGIENGCQNASELAYQDRVVNFLRSRPTVQIDGNALTLSNGNASLTLQRQGSVDHTLDGRTFRVTSLREGDTDVPVESGHTLRFVEGRVAASVGCNGISGTVESVGSVLVVVDLTSTLRDCDGDRARRDDAMRVLLGAQPSMDLADGQLRLSGGGVTLTAEEVITAPVTTSSAERSTSATTAPGSR